MNVQENTQGSSFTVRVEIWSDPETGEEGILPSPRSIADRRRAADMLDKDAAKKIAHPDEAVKEQGRYMKETAAYEREAAEKLDAARTLLLNDCVVHEYKLTKPLYGAYVQAVRKATKQVGSGSPTVDPVVLREELFPAAVSQDGQPVNVNSLDPQVADYLWGRLSSAMRPTEDRILFLSPKL